MDNIFLVTLKESIENCQSKRRRQIPDRILRNKYNLMRWLSTEILDYSDPTTVNHFLNQSTSKIKFGLEDFAKICIEIEDVSAVEDFTQELRDEIQTKRERRKEKLQLELKLTE